MPPVEITVHRSGSDRAPAEPPTAPSILYLGDRDPGGWAATEPACFRDLNLDQVVAGITANRPSELMPLYRTPLADVDSIAYRQEIFADLADPDVRHAVDTFARRRVVAQFDDRTGELRSDDGGFRHRYRQRWFLNSADEYCSAVSDFESNLRAAPIRSRGLLALREYVTSYLDSARFRALRQETADLETGLGRIRYVLAIRGDRLTVAPDDGSGGVGGDSGMRIAATFRRFHEGSGPTGPDPRPDWDDYAAAGVLDLVARLYPELFAAVDDFCTRRRNYLDPVIRRYDRDIQFYLAYLTYIEPLRRTGLPFSRPQVSATDKAEQALETFDLALAARLQTDGGRVVVNDITLVDPERILVITGPNNGGKTTLARTVGQLHWLARIGCPVPGRDCRLFLCDRILTHFPPAGDGPSSTGRLQTELDRLRADLRVATPATLIILNEMFASTTAADAALLGRRVLEIITSLDALCVCVTFLEELTRLNAKVVSMVGTVVPGDPATRTHRVVRRPADGRAYARALAEKYGLDFDHLIEELSR